MDGLCGATRPTRNGSTGTGSCCRTGTPRCCDHDGAALVTDEANHILDCAVPPGCDLAELAAAIKATLGVVEHGLFLGMTDEVLLGAPDGRIETLPNQQGPRH